MPTMTINKRLLDWFHENNITSHDRAVGLLEIPQDLAEVNLKGEIADLIENREIVIDRTGKFWVPPLVDLPGQKVKEVMQYAGYDNLLGRIYEDLRARTKENPIHSSDIEAKYSISGSAVRDIIRVLRRKGEPIIATLAGYYMATTPEEIKILVKDLSSRANSMYETLKLIKQKAYDRFGWQIEFDEILQG